MVGLYLLKLEAQAQNLRQFDAAGRAAAETLEQHAPRFQKCLGLPLAQARVTLLAAEALAAKIYWQNLGLLLNEYAHFEKRSRQPAQDAFNAALNYWYGMLYSVVESALFAAGLDPFLGIFHADEYRKPVLAFDFIEPFRPWVDALLIEQHLQHRVLAGFFSQKKGYGVLLNREGKQFFIPTFNEWLRSERLWGGKKTNVRNHIYQLAGRFATKLRNDYPEPEQPPNPLPPDDEDDE